MNVAARSSISQLPTWHVWSLCVGVVVIGRLYSTAGNDVSLATQIASASDIASLTLALIVDIFPYLVAGAMAAIATTIVLRLDILEGQIQSAGGMLASRSILLLVLSALFLAVVPIGATTLTIAALILLGLGSHLLVNNNMVAQLSASVALGLSLGLLGWNTFDPANPLGQSEVIQAALTDEEPPVHTISFVGYLVNDREGNIYFMQDEPRRLVSLPRDKIVSRAACSHTSVDDRTALQLLLSSGPNGDARPGPCVPELAG